MKRHFAGIVGWEKFAGQWFLRMKLAETHVKAVWPGLPSERTPEGELRRLSEEVLSADDVRRALTDAQYAMSQGYTGGDVRLLWRAYQENPMRERGQPDDRGPRPRGPAPL